MRPSILDEMSWAMAEVYESVTDRILVNMAKYFPYRYDPESVAGAQRLGAFEYQARMLAQMGKVSRETADIIANSLTGADAKLRESLDKAIVEALRTEEPKLRKAAEKGLLYGEGAVQPQLSPNQMNAFRTYYRQSADKLNLVNTVMLESTQAAYTATVSDVVNRIERTQSILNTATGEVVTGVSAWNQAMRGAVDRMISNGLTGFIDHGGHHWSPEAYVAMDIRTTMFNTARAAIWELNESYGNDLYQVSSHNGARPLCYPWQGKVISRSDAVREVEDLDGNRIHVYAQSETSYGEAAGLFGVNCKHYPMTFIPGVSTIKGEPQDPEENEKTYELSQQQRGLERKLREEKLQLNALKAQGAPENEIRAQQAKVAQASDDIRVFCDETGRTRRRSREAVLTNASFPDKDSYDPITFPTEQRDRITEFFTGNAGGYSETISSGAKKGPGWKDAHAYRFYEEVRKRKPGVDASKIAKYTDFTEEQAEDIRQHMFIREQPLDFGTRIARFTPDYEQAEAWQRLTEGRGTETDILLLKHEYLELTEMRKHGYNYDEAHDIANSRYNWWEAFQKEESKE